MGQWKKQMTTKNIDQKKKPLSQRAYFRKLFLKKYQNELNYPNITNIGANYKGNKKLSSKYNTLKNSRK